jgi:tRNA(fMet)-specific endonuclease VapC
MIYVLDTDHFTLAYYGRAGVRERIERERSTHTVLIGQVTRLEVLDGRIQAVLKAANGAAAGRAINGLKLSEEYLAGFDVLPFDARAGEQFDSLLQDKKVKKPGRKDLLIACIALAHDATLVTRNIKDFQPIPGLKVDNWAA